jgi:hypothetical protein
MSNPVNTARCAVCGTPLDPSTASACPHCDGRLHHHCAVWIGGCATYGCPGAATAKLRLTSYLAARLDELKRERILEVIAFAIGAALQAAYGGLLTSLAFALFFLAALVDLVQVFRLQRQRLSSGTSEPLSFPPDTSLLLGPEDGSRRFGFLAAIGLYLFGMVPYVLHYLVIAAVILPHGWEPAAVACVLLLWLAQRRYLTIYNLVESHADRLWLNWQDELRPLLLGTSRDEHDLNRGPVAAHPQEDDAPALKATAKDPGAV